MNLSYVQRAIATLGGVGLLPKAPGTWGSLVTLLLLWPVAVLSATLAAGLDPSQSAEFFGFTTLDGFSGNTPLSVFFTFFATNGLWIAVIGGSLLSLWCTNAAVERWGEDPPQMVIDEWAGQAIPLMGLPLTGSAQPDLLLLLGAFTLFRLFDITKPFGVDQVQQLPSGFGILADDLLAGCYAWICLQLILWLL